MQFKINQYYNDKAQQEAASSGTYGNTDDMLFYHFITRFVNKLLLYNMDHIYLDDNCEFLNLKNRDKKKLYQQAKNLLKNLSKFEYLSERNLFYFRKICKIL